jgi:hypothetical protein
VILAVLLTVAALGGVWVFLVPSVQSQIPATWQQNKFAQVVITGGFLLITVLVVSFVLKRVHESAV